MLNIKRKALAVFLSVTIVLGIIPNVAIAGNETTVEGLRESFNAKTTTKIVDKIKVYPADDRDVILQLLNSETNVYETVEEFDIDANGNARIEYPDQRKEKTYTTWRIYIPESNGTNEYISEDIKITTKNLADQKLNSKAACIYSVDRDVVIYDENMNTKRKQASTTKLMTALLTLEGTDLKGKSKVSKYAARTPWGIVHMRPGDIYYTRHLLNALLVASSNESANVLGEKNAGTVSSFIKKMNAKCDILSLNNTQYKNTHGLDANGHYTTAYDLAKLTKEVMKYPEFLEIIKKKEYTLKSVKYKKKVTLEATNELLRYSKSFLGGKTGYDCGAGYCFSGIYKYKGETFIATTLGASSNDQRFNDSKRLYRYIKAYGA